MMTPPTDITPEPTPEFVLNYDASCLPEPIAVPTPTPSPTPPQNEDESGMLVSIPPLEGEFTLLETGTMQESQSNIIFLDVDTTDDDISKQDCSNEPDDCSLRGAIRLAELDPKQQYVISIPNGTYPLSSTIGIRGNVVLVGEDYPNKTSANVIIARDSTITTSFMPFQVTFFYDIDNDNQATNSKLAIYNLSFIQHSTSVSSSVMQISNTLVEIYNSQFIDNLVGSGTISLVDSTENSLTSSQIIIKNTLFRDNETRIGGIGGAIFLRANSQDSLTLLQCTTLDNNYAHWGGGVATYFDNADGTMTIQDSNMINNRSHTLGYGAADQQGGQITFTNNYWSPIYSTNRGAVNSVSPSVVVNTPNPQNMLDFDCDVPPPPILISIENEPVFCLGLSSTNGVINIREEPDVLSNAIEENFPIGSSVGIVGVYINVWGRVSRSNSALGYAFYDWYYVEFLGDNNIIKRGWIRNDVIGSTKGCGDIPRYDANGIPFPSPLYDYRLPPPPENAGWYNSDWIILDNRNNPQINMANPPIIDGDECQSAPPTTAEAVKSHRACAKIVYYIYYDILSKIDTGQSLMLSRLIGAIYQNELKFQEDSYYLELAQKAIKANYWIVCNNSTNYPFCRDDISKIHEINPADLANIYLASMEAWYGKAFELLKWYWVLEQNNLLNFATLEELESLFEGDDFKLGGLDKLKLLISPEFENILVGENVFRSNTYGANDPWWWGNYGYGSTEYEQLKTEGHPNMVYCIIVRQFNDGGSVQGRVDNEDFWTDYIFVLINTTNIGQTSNYNREFIPPWLQNAIDSQTLPNPQYEICP